MGRVLLLHIHKGVLLVVVMGQLLHFVDALGAINTLSAIKVLEVVLVARLEHGVHDATVTELASGTGTDLLRFVNLLLESIRVHHVNSQLCNELPKDLGPLH